MDPIKQAQLLAAAGDVDQARRTIAAAPPGLVVIEVQASQATAVSPRRSRWEPTGGCAHPGCGMTLSASIGGGLKICWMHALYYGLQLDSGELPQ
jgi:hypothetical protein